MSSDKRIVRVFRRAVNKAKNVNRLTKQTSSFEGFFASKGAAYAIPDGDFARKATLKGGELQSHLQGMVNLIRDEDTMRLIVKLESQAKYTRYLSIVTTYGMSGEEESILLGFDWIEDKVTIGLVIPLWNDVAIELDGDGGFKIRTEFWNYMFKPVSVQTMWTALQWIHRCLATAHRATHYAGGLSHSWVGYYKNRITSPRECINYWESVDELENKRPVCLSYFDKVKTDEELLKGLIRHKLKEILTKCDLEEVTCRQVRDMLEEEMKLSLQHLKGYVDEQMLSIVGQMDSSSKITDTIFLGSEWNASNLEELKKNGVGYILNVTKEIDNFFPGTFEYMNIRVHDVEDADLLTHWGKTYRFLHKAKEKGSAALVHCRRGISRSASTVVAFLMKEQNLSLHDAMKLVKTKRNIVQPNAGFWKQLIIYEGILKSSKNRHNSLFRRRSNSDSTNLRRCHRKSRERHKKENGEETNDVDGTPEYAQTMPRIGNHHVPPILNIEPLEKPVNPNNHNSEVRGNNSSSQAQTTKKLSSPETSDDESSDEESASDSEDETGFTRTKLRRTLSEPVMENREIFSEGSPIPRKSRARTYVERGSKSDEETYEATRSPSQMSEIFEKALDDVLYIKARKTSETDSLSDEGQRNSGFSEETRLFHGTATKQDDLFSEEQSRKFVESHGEICDELDLSEVDPNVSVGRRAGSELKSGFGGLSSDQVQDISTETEDSTTVGNHEVKELTKEEPQTEGGGVTTGNHLVLTVNTTSAGDNGSRLRSRSVGEKLEDKRHLKQGKSESPEGLKKVDGRGRVRRRERKSKSDLQLSNCGFVKRHTQIIEEQMLYSMLKNSEKTLASSATNLTNNNSEVIEGVIPIFSVKDPSPEKDSESKEDRRLASDTIQNIVQEVNAEAKQDIKDQVEVSRLPLACQKESTEDARENGDVWIDEMTWIDLTRHQGEVVKRKSAAFENVSDKRNPTPAKTENSYRRGKHTEEAAEKLVQSSVRSREEVAVDKCVSPELVDEVIPDIPTDDAHQEVCIAQVTNDCESCVVRLDGEVPKLDLEQLGKAESFEVSHSSHSIVVKDYRQWESSSVRERTKILENIIAKTGGSFPSPRSRMIKNEEERAVVDEKLDQEVGWLLSSSRENVTSGDMLLQCKEEHDSGTRGFSCPPDKNVTESLNDDNCLGDEAVKVLVNKFEGKNGDTDASENNDQSN